MDKDRPRCAFTLRRGDAVFVGLDKDKGIALLLDEMGKEKSRAVFLVAGALGHSKLDVPYYETARLPDGVKMHVEPQRAMGQRIKAVYIFPDRSYFARRLNPEEKKRYFPER